LAVCRFSSALLELVRALLLAARLNSSSSHTALRAAGDMLLRTQRAALLLLLLLLLLLQLPQCCPVASNLSALLVVLWPASAVAATQAGKVSQSVTAVHLLHLPTQLVQKPAV
jgi:hypothetical protein